MEKNKIIINENINKLKESLGQLKNNEVKFLFCIPNVQTPSALIYELYFHAHVLTKKGFEVIMLTESDDFSPPDYIEDELINKKHINMGSSKIKVGPQDFMIIPESFSNVMEQTKNLPCKRIGFLQSFDYMLNALIPGTSWRDFEIGDIITTSNMLKDTVNLFFDSEFFNIKTYDIGIPEYFNNDGKPKKPVISIVGRNPNEITKIVKLFYAKYPHYRWISFDAMLTNSKPPKPLSRFDFANRLKENFAAIWVDRISSFGTFPLECMKSGVIPICLKPDITPDYLINKENDEEVKAIDNLGVWTKDFYDLPILIGNVTTKFLDDSLSKEIFETMTSVSQKYTQENSEKQINKIYEEYIEERIKLFENIINKNENEESNDNNTSS